MCDHQLAHVFPVPVALLAEDRLRARVVPGGVVEGRVLTLRGGAVLGLVPVVAPAGERPRGLVMSSCVYILRVSPQAVGVVLERRIVAEAEQLHHLAGVVLVGRPLVGVGAVEPQEHRRIVGDVVQQVLEVADRVASQQPVLAQHVAGVADPGVGRREVVVQVQRHPLLALVGRAHHPVEPPQAVVAPGVERVDRRCRRPWAPGRPSWASRPAQHLQHSDSRAPASGTRRSASPSRRIPPATSVARSELGWQDAELSGIGKTWVESTSFWYRRRLPRVSLLGSGGARAATNSYLTVTEREYRIGTSRLTVPHGVVTVYCRQLWRPNITFMWENQVTSITPPNASRVAVG